MQAFPWNTDKNTREDDRNGYLIPTQDEFIRAIDEFYIPMTVYVQPISREDMNDESISFYLDRADSYVLRMSTCRKTHKKMGHLELRFESEHEASECVRQLNGQNNWKVSKSIEGTRAGWEKDQFGFGGVKTTKVFKRTVTLSGLPDTVTEDVLYEKFPEAIQAFIPRVRQDFPIKRIQGVRLGYAFITFPSEEQAKPYFRQKVDIGGTRPNHVHAILDFPTIQNALGELRRWDMYKDALPMDNNLVMRMNFLQRVCTHYIRCKETMMKVRSELEAYRDDILFRLRDYERYADDSSMPVFVKDPRKAGGGDDDGDIPSLVSMPGPSRGGRGRGRGRGQSFRGHGHGGAGGSGGFGGGGFYDESEGWEGEGGPPPKFVKGPHGLELPKRGGMAGRGRGGEYMGDKLANAVDLIIGLSQTLQDESGHGGGRPMKRGRDQGGYGEEEYGGDFSYGNGAGYDFGYGGEYSGGYGGGRGGQGMNPGYTQRSGGNKRVIQRGRSGFSR